MGNVFMPGGGSYTELYEHMIDIENPHNVTAEQVEALPFTDIRDLTISLTSLLQIGVHGDMYLCSSDNNAGTPYDEGITTAKTFGVLSMATSGVSGFQMAFPIGTSSGIVFFRYMTSGTVSLWSSGFLPLTGGTLSGQLSLNSTAGVPIKSIRSNKSNSDVNWSQDFQFETSDGIRVCVIRSAVNSSGNRTLTLGVSDVNNSAPNGIQIIRLDSDSGQVYALAPENDITTRPQIRNIYAGTNALTAGTSTLANGHIYLQYEN